MQRESASRVRRDGYVAAELCEPFAHAREPRAGLELLCTAPIIPGSNRHSPGDV